MGDSFYKWKKRTNRECMKSEKQIFTFRWKCESERDTHTKRLVERKLFSHYCYNRSLRD